MAVVRSVSWRSAPARRLALARHLGELRAHRATWPRRSAGVVAAAREPLASCTLGTSPSLGLLRPKPPRCMSPPAQPASDGVWGGERSPGRVAVPLGHWSPVTVRAVGCACPVLVPLCVLVHTLSLSLHLQPPCSRRRAGGLDGAAPLASLHLEASLGVLEQWSLATVCVTAI